ncbi:hypothetical protein JTE90_015249 [Oedothorax gibbosus]|uniref:Kynurenine formamidase n=1 Tax=Oedothorax gibbosus TaxID=931172 RepID=A0AAV6TYE0_9ARAC|nr:hypothetical protein JTE90_015249 [Oedothorax gibbosus]
MRVLLIFMCVAFGVYGAPLTRQMVDMTYTFDETTPYHPTLKKYERDTLVINEDPKDPYSAWIQLEEYASSTHAGTHMDAPRHFNKNGKTIDQLDITNFIAPAAVVDITRKAELNPDAEATVEDLLHWESVTGQNLNGTILMLRTGWGKKWGDKAAYYGAPVENPNPSQLHYPGISSVAAQWLVDNRNILGIGIDTVSFDSGASKGYPAHKILLGHGIFALENVAKMEDIPIYGAELHVMPMKIGGGSGAPTRVIAIFPEVVLPSTYFCHT